MKQLSWILIMLNFFSSLIIAQPSHYQLYLWAQYNQHQSNTKITEECYAILFKSHAPVHAYPGYLEYLFKEKQFATIAQLMPKVEESLHNRLDIQLIFVQALEHLGKFEESSAKLITLSKEYPNKAEVVYYATLAHIRQKQFQKALALVDTFLKKNVRKKYDFMFHFLKAQVMLNMDNKQEALKQVKKSLELYPEFGQGWLFLGLIHEFEGNLDEAMHGYQKCLELVGHDKTIERQLAYLQLLKTRQSKLPQQHRNHFHMAMHLYKQRKYIEALKYLDQSIIENPNHMLSRLLKIEIFCLLHRDREAINLIGQWLEQQPYNQHWYKVLHLLYRAHVDVVPIIETLKKVEYNHPENILSLLYQADLFIRINQPHNALRYLNKTLAFTKDPVLQTRILFQVALMYYQQQKYDLFTTIAQQALALKQDFPPLLNLMAYYYVTREKNYKKAQELISAALNKDNNPHFLDTQALIWYKQHDYAKAEQLLLKVVQKVPHDTYVLKHLGKTLHKVGKTIQAKNALQQALKYTQAQEPKEKLKKLLQNI